MQTTFSFQSARHVALTQTDPKDAAGPVELQLDDLRHVAGGGLTPKGTWVVSPSSTETPRGTWVTSSTETPRGTW